MKHLLLAAFMIFGSIGMLNAKPKPKEWLEAYNNASFAQKRDIIRIEYEAHKNHKAKTEKFKTEREALEFEIENLQIDLEEAHSKQDTAKAKEIFNHITQKQEALRKNKQEEKNLVFSLDEEKIKKINAVLKP